MERPHPRRGADCGSSARRYSGRLLLPAIAGLLIACGGASSSSTSTSAPGTATLAWDAVSAAGLNGYKVYYGPAPGVYLQGSGQGISVGDTTYTVTGLSSGTTYYFAVTVYGSSNESGPSNEVLKNIP